MLFAGNNASEEGTGRNLDVMKIEFQFVDGFFHAIMFVMLGKCYRPISMNSMNSMNFDAYNNVADKIAYQDKNMSYRSN